MSEDFVLKTEDGVDVYSGDDIYVCVKRKNSWYYGGCITFKKSDYNLFKTNKSFSTEEKAKEFIQRTKKIFCIDVWNGLPEVFDFDYQIFHSTDFYNDQNFLHVCVMHLENGVIFMDYLKSIKLKSFYGIELKREIDEKLEVIYKYFKK